jgi:hypothetical protein
MSNSPANEHTITHSTRYDTVLRAPYATSRANHIIAVLHGVSDLRNSTSLLSRLTWSVLSNAPSG